MPTPTLKCSLCQQDFSTEHDAKNHWIQTHGSGKCHLCNRDGAAKASNYCLTCKTHYLASINSIEGMETHINNLHRQLASLQNTLKKKQLQLKTEFLHTFRQHFCAHNLPKTETCGKCEAFEAREIRDTRARIIYIDLD